MKLNKKKYKKKLIFSKLSFGLSYYLVEKQQMTH